MELMFNADILHSDFVIDLPTMKAHNQTIVSLGIKNLKGMINIPSRKKCHNADPVKGLPGLPEQVAVQQKRFMVENQASLMAS